jgi:hypothetical protein
MSVWEPVLAICAHTLRRALDALLEALAVTLLTVTLFASTPLELKFLNNPGEWINKGSFGRELALSSELRHDGFSVRITFFVFATDAIT